MGHRNPVRHHCLSSRRDTSHSSLGTSQGSQTRRTRNWSRSGGGVERNGRVQKSGYGSDHREMRNHDRVRPKKWYRSRGSNLRPDGESRRRAPMDPQGVGFNVTNTGKRAGAEIAELYVEPVRPVARPLKDLNGFKKVFLQPGESRKVTINLDRRSLAYFPGDCKKNPGFSRRSFSGAILAASLQSPPGVRRASYRDGCTRR